MWLVELCFSGGVRRRPCDAFSRDLKQINASSAVAAVEPARWSPCPSVMMTRVLARPASGMSAVAAEKERQARHVLVNASGEDPNVRRPQGGHKFKLGLTLPPDIASRVNE
jgi:hypothetical protein